MSLLDPRDTAWLNDRLLGEIAGVLARPFEGQVVTASVGGRPLTGRLDSARLERGALRQGARIELSDVDWDGWAIERLEARARSVRTSRLPPPRLIATDVDITGRSQLAALVAWLDGVVPRWSLSVDRHGRLEARRVRGTPAAVLEAAVVDHELELEVRAVGWRRARLRVPRRLRPRRRVALPPLVSELSVVEAGCCDGVVDFRCAVRTLRLPG